MTSFEWFIIIGFGAIIYYLHTITEQNTALGRHQSNDARTPEQEYWWS